MKKKVLQKTVRKRSHPVRDVQWNFRLYVAGQTPKSITAFTNLKRICEEHLRGRYRIKVIDLTTAPQLAQDDQIVALPTLIRQLPVPVPVRRVIGDLSNAERVLIGLDLSPAPQPPPASSDS